MSMDEVVPGLWIGDLPSALNVENLKAHGIYSILSAMRGRLTIKETFLRHQILVDDEADADILRHLLPSIHFIQAELDKGRGVLVHCHAGVSRSATIVAAYLMYTKNKDTEGALEMIRAARPHIEPNQGFLQQLELFHKAHFKVSQRDKGIRMFYMERALEEVMNGDGSLPDSDMFARFPQTPVDSTPSTPGVPAPRRRIRCKMCRQELAAREHMLDHGQLGPPTPAFVSPANSRRPSRQSPRPSMNQIRPVITSPAEAPRSRRPSTLLSDTLTMSSLSQTLSESNGQEPSPKDKGPPSTLSRSSSVGEKPSLGMVPEKEALSPSAVDDSALEDDSEEETPAAGQTIGAGGAEQLYGIAGHPLTNTHAKMMGRRMSDAVRSTPDSNNHSDENIPEAKPHQDEGPSTTHINAEDLAAELLTNPKLAALRSADGITPKIPVSAPILANPKCSGYFVEPMKWMEPFLEAGQLGGKIICPNPKCGAKLGNYDWAGVCCGCKEWVVPGFCINRSKVDEIVR